MALDVEVGKRLRTQMLLILILAYQFNTMTGRGEHMPGAVQSITVMLGIVGTHDLNAQL